MIWAGGEFSHPRTGNFPGADLCAHASVFRDWQDYGGDDALIIGGYESGMDAACNLLQLGKRVVLLSSGEPWKVDHPDPSEILSHTLGSVSGIQSKLTQGSSHFWAMPQSPAFRTYPTNIS